MGNLVLVSVLYRILLTRLHGTGYKEIKFGCLKHSLFSLTFPCHSWLYNVRNPLSLIYNLNFQNLDKYDIYLGHMFVPFCPIQLRCVLHLGMYQIVVSDYSAEYEYEYE